jgi:predicted dehydrogenase
MIKLAVVGTGGMANAHAQSFQAIRGVKIVAACDVVRERAEEYAAKYGIKAVYTDVDELLASEEIDAITNVTPDAAHAEVSLKAIAKGKHVLCEKPLAVNYPDARKMAAAAKRKGVINMVNLSYRNSAAIHKAHQIVQQGVLGRIMHVEASYLQSWLSRADWTSKNLRPGMLWRLSTKHGSKGVLGDLGVHIIDFATYPAGDAQRVDCRLKAFPKTKTNRHGEYVFDANDSAIVLMEFAGGALGTIHTSRWATGHGNSLRLRVHGDKGALVVDLDTSYDTLELFRGNDLSKTKWKTIKCPKTPNMYQRFIRSIRTGKNDQPDFARGAAVQKVLDACFESDRAGKPVKV